MGTLDYVTPYREYFTILRATSSELRDRVHHLRYDVYCQELHWEDPNAHPDRLETDPFDDDAVHCLLIHKPTGRDAGTVRFVPSRPDDPRYALPLMYHYDPGLFYSRNNPMELPGVNFGEISRLALHQQFRRRAGEQGTPEGHGLELFQWTQSERRRFPHIALGLYLAAAAVGISEGVDGVFAMMELRLARHLRYGNINFDQVGHPVELRGQRAPFYISRHTLYDSLSDPLRDLLNAIADDLAVAI